MSNQTSAQEQKDYVDNDMIVDMENFPIVRAIHTHMTVGHTVSSDPTFTAAAKAFQNALQDIPAYEQITDNQVEIGLVGILYKYRSLPPTSRYSSLPVEEYAELVAKNWTNYLLHLHDVENKDKDLEDYNIRRVQITDAVAAFTVAYKERIKQLKVGFDQIDEATLQELVETAEPFCLEMERALEQDRQTATAKAELLAEIAERQA